MQRQSPVAESEKLEAEDAARERLVFGLRRLEGVACEAFERETGYRVESLGGAALKEYQQHGLLEMREGTLRLTRKGLLVSDALWPAFLRG